MTREEAIQELQNCKGLIQQDGQDYLDERDIPLLDMAIEVVSADAVQGEWIEVEDDYGGIYWECSNCEDAFFLEAGTPKDNNYNFCPSCGARMKGGDDE